MERQTDQLTNAGLKVIKKAYLRVFSSGEPKMTYCKCMFMIFLIPPPPPPTPLGTTTPPPSTPNLYKFEHSFIEVKLSGT